MRQAVPRHLILSFPMSQYWCRMIALGAAKYARNVGNWYPVLMDHRMVEQALREHREIDNWAGVIGNFYDSHGEMVRTLKEWDIPVVNTASEPLSDPVPTVCNDERETGIMAARYLFDRGHRRFAFVGIDNRYFSARRLDGFEAFLSGQPLSEIIHAPGGSYEPLVKWVPALKKPCAIFAANDTRARHTLWACAAHGIHVPQEVSVLGVDDDELFCHMNMVATSSVAPVWEEIGNRAAAVLEQLAGNPMSFPEDYREELLPRKVSVRQSTDHVAVDDPFVARAIAIIKKEGLEGLKVYDLAQKLGVSRRTLERRFESVLQIPVRQVILNARLDKAHQLLTTTRLSIGEIAARTGFSMHSRFDDAFRKRYRRTPTEARRGMT